ncbi:unnamed protein product [Polarella glacialis]|uniref:Protein kinase domain-containing protein n=1 Tax=Polarella glacialis TaxID=89957 RepID=A0A813IGQ9_POLGL|nr:unnamed protein product [Polarella glacialis]CAE8649314.1 unnamed protein product [Polarella glacialis]
MINGLPEFLEHVPDEFEYPERQERTVSESECDGIDQDFKHDCISSLGFFTVKPSELKLLSKLGAGAHANVHKAVWTRSFAASTSSIIVAVKSLQSDLDAIYRDRESLTILTDHPNLVKCFDSTLDPPYLVVTEFCAGGSLFNLLYNTTQELSARQRIKVLLDVATGMRYLHAQKPCILHRDLKSSNVLLTKPIRQLPWAFTALLFAASHQMWRL